MGNERTCCVTGHRDIPTDKMDTLRAKLRQEVIKAISEGYTHFISGFASGVDLLFAEIVSDLKSQYPITLEAAIPHPGRMSTPDKLFQRLIKTCNVVKIHSDHYHGGCYMVRNRYMVDHSSLLLAACDGRKSGGTAATVRYANAIGRIVKEIHI